MALDPPLTDEEERFVLLLRDLREHEVAVDTATDDERQAEDDVSAARRLLRNVQGEMVRQVGRDIAAEVRRNRRS